MKVGIVGGTFNPIHVGHLMLGEYAYEEFLLDAIWFMPNGNPPHKDANTFSISTKARIAMVELAITGTSYFHLSKHEIEKESVSYSYKTMKELCEKYPENEFYFIVGSDSLFSLEQWKKPELLFEYCTILVACRENMDLKRVHQHIDYLKEKYACKMKLLQMPLLEVSSSNIRSRLQENKSVKYIVPEVVHEYMTTNRLYNETRYNNE
ncbi:MAG: nicotinate-nucleotide adenylyltransferase [Eubacteriales bacterium]